MTDPTCVDPQSGCITCGDVAVPLTVVRMIDGDAQHTDAECRDERGRTEVVALDFVSAGPGDRVLVHAGVALERLAGETDALR